MPISIGDLKLYTVEELAGLLGLAPKTVRGLVRTGKFKGQKLSGRWYVPEATVQDYFNRDRAKDPAES